MSALEKSLTLKPPGRPSRARRDASIHLDASQLRKELCDLRHFFLHTEESALASMSLEALERRYAELDREYGDRFKNR